MTDQEQELIKAYLRKVEARLAGLPRNERSAVLGNLEAQIHDSLASRCPDAVPTPDDVAAVLVDMDPPEAFGADSPPRPAAASRPGVGAAALLISLLGLLVPVLASLAAHSRGGTAIVLSPLVLLPQLIALIVAVFSRGAGTGKAAIALSSLIIVGVFLLGFLGVAHA